MRVLVDSSVWIEYFRGSAAASSLNTLLDSGQLCVNELILAELIPALMHQRQQKIVSLLREVDMVSLSPDWQNVVAMQTANLRHGINKVGIADVLIAQQAILEGLALWSFDKHFALMAKQHDLRLWHSKG